MQPIQPEAVWDGVLDKNSMWAFADQGSYKMTLRRTLKNWSKIKDRANELSTIINDKFNEEKLFAGFCEQFYNEAEQKELEDEIDSLLQDLI